MFGIGKKHVDVERKLEAVKYNRIYNVLKDLAGMEPIKEDGEVDYEASYNAMRQKAKLALDFVRDIDSDQKA